MSNASNVQIIIPVYNALQEVQKCFESLRNSCNFEELAITFIDDHSESETRNWLQQLSTELANVVVIRNLRNRGFTKTVNRGLRHLTRKYVLILNSDTQISTRAIEQLVNAVEISENVAGAGPLSNAASWQSVPMLFDENKQFKINSLPKGTSLASYAQKISDLIDPKYPEVPLLNGFCMLFRASSLAQVGLLDEKNFPKGYGEENDLCIRLIDEGFKLVIADDSYVFHSKSASYGHKTRLKLSELSGKKLEKKHGNVRMSAVVSELENNSRLNAVRALISKIT